MDEESKTEKLIRKIKNKIESEEDKKLEKFVYQIEEYIENLAIEKDLTWLEIVRITSGALSYFIEEALIEDIYHYEYEMEASKEEDKK